MDQTLLPSNSFCRIDKLDSRAMSVMSSTSYQYTGESLVDIDDKLTSPPESPMLLSDQDLALSLESYNQLLRAAVDYREQMKRLSSAAAEFGHALERIAHGKTASDAGQGLQAAAGLQLLISNHQQILSDMFEKEFEIPLRENIKHQTDIVKQSQENYDAAVKFMTKKIHDTEKKNLGSSRNAHRDIRQFRKTLQDLTRQVDELDRIKSDYNRHMIDVERKNHSFILGKVATIVRSQVDIYERISNKGLVDPVLEQMMRQNPDPFCAYSTRTDDMTEIFTVLPPISLIDSQITQLGDQRYRFSTSPDNDDSMSDAMRPISTHGKIESGFQRLHESHSFFGPEMSAVNPDKTLNGSHSASHRFAPPEVLESTWIEKEMDKVPDSTMLLNEKEDRHPIAPISPLSGFVNVQSGENGNAGGQLLQYQP